MGFDKAFIDKAFKERKDWFNRTYWIDPQELIEIPDDDITFLENGIFSFLPKNEFIKKNKLMIREKYHIPERSEYKHAMPLKYTPFETSYHMKKYKKGEGLPIIVAWLKEHGPFER